MVGSGSLIVVHENGWSCAKECLMDMEFDVLPDKTAKRAMVVKNITGLFDVIGECSGEVKGIFKGDSGAIIAFNGKMNGKARLEIIGQVNNDFETILNKIKNGWSITG